jgi:hypothetical protein
MQPMGQDTHTVREGVLTFTATSIISRNRGTPSDVLAGYTGITVFGVICAAGSPMDWAVRWASIVGT